MLRILILERSNILIIGGTTGSSYLVSPTGNLIPVLSLSLSLS